MATKKDKQGKEKNQERSKKMGGRNVEDIEKERRKGHWGKEN